MQDNLILKTTAVVLAIAVFISANDAKDIRRSEQSAVCGPCQDNSSFSYVFILRGCGDHKSYMYIDLLSPNGSSNVVAKKYANPLDIRVNHCRSTIEHRGAYHVIKIRSYVQINALVGVKSIAEGSNLTLQVMRDGVDKSHYQMHLEPDSNTFTKFALAFVPHNATTDKYYVIPEGEGDIAMLTLRKNPRVDKFVFQFQETNFP